LLEACYITQDIFDPARCIGGQPVAINFDRTISRIARGFLKALASYDDDWRFPGVGKSRNR
jgi:hypothetical protein